MIKAIMAVDDEGGISKNGSMPWPKNLNDLKWFKNNTLNNIVIMGRFTWVDPFMPSPLKNRINVLITKQEKDTFIIGGQNIIEQSFELIEKFYLTRIYGKFNCDKKLDLQKIEDKMILEKKIQSDKTSHFEIWKR